MFRMAGTVSERAEKTSATWLPMLAIWPWLVVRLESVRIDKHQLAMVGGNIVAVAGGTRPRVLSHVWRLEGETSGRTWPALIHTDVSNSQVNWAGWRSWNALALTAPSEIDLMAVPPVRGTGRLPQCYGLVVDPVCGGANGALLFGEYAGLT